VKHHRAKNRVSARSAGSKSLVDVWALDLNTRTLIIEQCKTGKAKLKPAEKAFAEQVRRLEGEPFKIKYTLITK